jgi:four helix bundle protein
VSEFGRLEELQVYQKLCRLHIEVCELTHKWPGEEKFELGSQARRSSNSSAAQLAEKYDDRHVRNKIEGVNRSRGEAGETTHHLYIALLKGYETEVTYEQIRARYKECIRMLNGIERKLEMYLPERERRWPDRRGDDSVGDPRFSGQGDNLRETSPEYGALPPGYPEAEPFDLEPDP